MNGQRRCSVHTHTQIYSRILLNTENEILPFTAKWMVFESVMLSEIGQTKTNTV